MKKISVNNLKVDENLFSFINEEVAPNTGINPKHFWEGFSVTAHKLLPINRKLLKKRDEIQKKINDWHTSKKGSVFNKSEYFNFLKSIGYIYDEEGEFKINTSNVDEEISSIPGPQLVVPVDNARYALNAANARWGSLYDSLYGTDVITGKRGNIFDVERAKRVITYVREFFDASVPINNLSWKEITKIEIKENDLHFSSGKKTENLKNKNQFAGFNGDKKNPSLILFKNNSLHIEIQIDSNSKIGKMDGVGISDVILESAVSTIVDNEDSVAAVDSADKVKCYRNWLGLMKGTLETEVSKNGKKFIRKLNSDRNYISPVGSKVTLRGRALLLNRNVGHLMTNPAIIVGEDSEIPEGIMDAFISVFCALHDFKNKKNSRKGSVYIVKPKMHGPEEVDFTNSLFEEVENVLKLKRFTIKLGIMDEERRTTVNLKECIRKVKERIVFINTGFLDRTGDEMHTSFELGPMIFKNEMKKSKWLNSYEDWNVDIGLSCGFSGKAQIGKGMWAMPDKMSDMMKQKIIHPKSGANCAWVPSPTAATLHATHYHKIDVFKKQTEIMSREKAKITNILEIPVADRPNWSVDEINKELENNAQGILGYVVRWIDQGIGCSKVPDINNVGLMEDRATLRISSQHMANWLHQKICTRDEVMQVMKKMAKIVDKQNINDKNYTPMAKNFDSSVAFKTACDLIFEGASQPSGYTEPLLHKRRLEKKSNH